MGGRIGPEYPGCGRYYELTDAGARQLAESDSLNLPASLEGQFVEAAGCSQCDGKDMTVDLKPISGLYN